MSGSNWAVYTLADTFQIPLDPIGENLFKGGESKKVMVGPIPMKFPVRFETDFVKPGEAAAFVHLRGHLWAYSYVKASSGKTATHWLVFFNGAGKLFSDLRTGSVTLTLQSLIAQKLVAACYLFENDEWLETEPETLQARLKAK